MQNIVNQWEIIRSQITWFAHRYLYCSGNWTANVLVTETAQYSALHCFFDFKQNDEYLLISNTLQFICSILLALAFYFILHCTRHTYATLSLALGTDIITIKNVLGHKQESTTMRYTKVVNPLKEQAAKRLSINTISQNTEQYEKGNF